MSSVAIRDYSWLSTLILLWPGLNCKLCVFVVYKTINFHEILDREGGTIKGQARGQFVFKGHLYLHSLCVFFCCENVNVCGCCKLQKFWRATDFLKQDACTGVHSACRREENGHNLYICVLRRLRLRQGQMQGFLGLKVGERGSYFANMGFKSSTWNRKNCFQHV